VLKHTESVLIELSDGLPHERLRCCRSPHVPHSVQSTEAKQAFRLPMEAVGPLLESSIHYPNCCTSSGVGWLCLGCLREGAGRTIRVCRIPALGASCMG